MWNIICRIESILSLNDTFNRQTAFNKVSVKNVYQNKKITSPSSKFSSSKLVYPLQYISREKYSVLKINNQFEVTVSCCEFLSAQARATPNRIKHMCGYTHSKKQTCLHFVSFHRCAKEFENDSRGKYLVILWPYPAM